MTIYINIGLGGGGRSSGADPDSSIVVVSGSQSASSLTNSRTVVAGTGMQIIDGGPGGNLTFVATGVVGPTGPTGPTGAQGAVGAFILTPMSGWGGAGQTTLVVSGTLLMSTSAGKLSASLSPPALAGTMVIFKDIHGSASVNPFTVYPTNNAKIDNVSSSYTYYINFGTLKLFSDGANWFTW